MLWLLPLLGWSNIAYCDTPAADPWAAQRRQFLAAERAIEKRNLGEYERIAPQLADYPLYPYLLFGRLNATLGPDKYDEARRFVTQYADSPLASRLRGRWLDQLASRHQWREYVEAYVPQTDVSRRCHHIQALLAVGEREQALADAEEVWLQGASQPKACDPVFEALVAAGRVTPELAWRRIELALDKGEWGLAGHLKRYLPASEKAIVDRWVEIYRNPTLIAQCQRRPQLLNLPTQVLADGVVWLARKDPIAAFGAWRDLRGTVNFDPAQRQAMVSALAQTMLSRNPPAAADFFEQVSAQEFDDLAGGAALRWAVRNGRWPLIGTWFDTLPQPLQQEPAWRYWRARAWRELGDQDQARVAFQDVAKVREFYGFMAADAVATDYSLNHQPLAPDKALLTSFQSSPFVTRVMELRRLNRLSVAAGEWWQGLSNADKATFEAAIYLADQLGWHRIAILTAARAEALNDINVRFPIAYRSLIDEESAATRLDEPLVLAVVRRESAFDPFAVSGSGARGLMQIMPATGKDISRSLKTPWSSPWMLHDPDTNVRFGTHYLDQQLAKFDDQLPLALAAYNGGPGNVSRWLRFDGTLAADRWIENIPFTETRDYVQAVLAYEAIYRHRLGMPLRRVSENLRPIAGTGAPAVAYRAPTQCALAMN